MGNRHETVSARNKTTLKLSEAAGDEQSSVHTLQQKPSVAEGASTFWVSLIDFCLFLVRIKMLYPTLTQKVCCVRRFACSDQDRTSKQGEKVSCNSRRPQRNSDNPFMDNSINTLHESGSFRSDRRHGADGKAFPLRELCEDWGSTEQI
ncbi:uncharacterized protein V6R79_009933 [Siganus canaliculatus]